MRKILTAWVLMMVATVLAAESRDGIFLHVTHGYEQPQRVMMALSLASTMAEGHPVLMYFDIRGVDVLLKDSEEIAMEPYGIMRERLAQLLEAGVEIMACPGCLQAAGYSAEDLMEGVKIAEKSRFFRFTSGRILSLDY